MFVGVSLRNLFRIFLYKTSHNLLCKVHVWRIRERDFVNGSGKEPGGLQQSAKLENFGTDSQFGRAYAKCQVQNAEMFALRAPFT